MLKGGTDVKKTEVMLVMHQNLNQIIEHFWAKGLGDC